MKTQGKKKYKGKPGSKSGQLSPRGKEQNIVVARKIAEDLCESEGMELVHTEYANKEGHDVMRVYIDKPGGVGLDDCVTISRQLSDLLDIHLPTGSSYRLEVSSPGIERPLSKASDFLKFKGKRVTIKTKNSIEGRRNFKGVLLGISEGIVTLATGDDNIAIPHREISRARLVNDVGENEC